MKLALALTLVLATGALAADWPHMRGPAFDGAASDPVDAHALKQVWQAAVDAGYAGTVVVAGRVYTMGNDGHDDVVRCLDEASGKDVWSFRYPCALGANGYAGGPAATPTVAGGRVYTLSREGHIHALDAATGAKVWAVQASAFGASPPAWGFAGAPTVVGEALVVNVGDSGAAVSLADGHTLWSSTGPGAGYGPAIPLAVPGQPLAVALFDAAGLRAVDVASGRVLWTFAWKTPSDVNAAAPLVFDGKIFISSGYDTGCALVDVSRGSPVEVWRNRELKSHFSSAVYHDGHIYGVDGNAGRRGAVVCLDAATGTAAWRAPVGFGSLALSAGTLLVLEESGNLGLLAAEAKGAQPLGGAQLLSGKCWTAPTVADGRVFARSDSGELVCWSLVAAH